MRIGDACALTVELQAMVAALDDAVGDPSLAQRGETVRTAIAQSGQLAAIVAKHDHRSIRNGSCERPVAGDFIAPTGHVPNIAKEIAHDLYSLDSSQRKRQDWASRTRPVLP
jgi:hypothetical protein